MKSYEAIYSKGHLLDVKTGQRIFLKRGEKFIITGQDEHFEEKDALKREHQIRSSDDKHRSLKSQHKNDFLIKIADAGTVLQFGINITKKTQEDEKEKFLFSAVLLEDLYLRSKGGKEEKDWSLCDCTCEITECIEGDLNMFEPLQSKSLNSLFTDMVGFYFNGQRNPACNPFKTYRIIYDTTNTLQYSASKTLLLDEVRKREIRNWSNDINVKLIEQINGFLQNNNHVFDDLKARINDPEQPLSQEDKLDFFKGFLKTNAFRFDINETLIKNEVLDVKSVYYNLF